jgi:hypothetical protein
MIEEKEIWVYDDSFKLKKDFPMTVTLDNYNYPDFLNAAVIVNDQLYLFWV